MRLNKKLVVLVVVALAVTMVVMGCKGNGGETGSKRDKGDGVETAELSGLIQIAGSTSVQGLSEELAAEFMARNPKVKVNVAGGGSGAGIKSAQDGTADIGASSRELKPEEKRVHEIPIANDGIAIIVHRDNAVENLTLEQVKQVFSGEIGNWKDLGGTDAAITLVVREDGSGTRGAFEEIAMGDASISSSALIQNSTGGVRTAVAGNADAIGFISLGSLNEEIKALKIDGATADTASVVDGSYKIARPFLYLTKEEPQGIVKVFVDFILSDDGQKIVEESFVPVK